MSQATRTTDHGGIRRSAGARPSRQPAGRGGTLGLDFAEDDEKAEETRGEEFFKIFEDSKLALLLQDKAADGNESRLAKFVSRDD